MINIPNIYNKHKYNYINIYKIFLLINIMNYFSINDIKYSDKEIVNIIDNLDNINFFFIKTKCNINNILNKLPPKFDNYADIHNNNDLLILYNTENNKVKYRLIKDEFILIISLNKLIILINNIITIKLINIIKKLNKLKNMDKLYIDEIYINIDNIDNISNYLSNISNNIIII